ncbi:MAG TPA: hypothetical protein VF753_04330, partial [Terriglobales bacterium]
MFTGFGADSELDRWPLARLEPNGEAFAFVLCALTEFAEKTPDHRRTNPSTLSKAVAGARSRAGNNKETGDKPNPTKKIPLRSASEEIAEPLVSV